MGEIGRPSKYKKEYCEMLIEHMSKGLSFESFAAIPRVCDDTLREWEKVNPDFSAAKKIAFQLNRLFWEKLGIDHILNESTSEQEGKSRSHTSKTLNSTVWIFNMKNRFPKQWREKVDHEIEAKQEIKHSPEDVKLISEFVQRAKEFQIKNGDNK